VDYAELTDRELAERLGLSLGWRKRRLMYPNAYTGESEEWADASTGIGICWVSEFRPETWQGMGMVIEAMLETHGWELHLDYSIDGAYAEFSRLPEKGVVAANAPRPPRAVALAALSALSKRRVSDFGRHAPP
jgi:hypothetical protein